MGRIRPRTKFVRKLKERRCRKCGAKLNPQRTRCKRCSEKQPRPKKRLVKGRKKPKRATAQK